MPAAVPIAIAVIAAAGTTYSMVESNQAKQHAKGAAQAQETAMNAQLDTANKQTLTDKTSKADSGSATQTAAMNALKASMSSSNSMGGTILTGPQGAPAAPTQAKTLLGV